MDIQDATLPSMPASDGADRDDFTGAALDADPTAHVDDDSVMARLELRRLVMNSVCPKLEASSSTGRSRTLRRTAEAASFPQTLLSDEERKKAAATARAAERSASERAELEAWPIPAMEEYLEQLCSYSVVRLVEEPERQAAAAVRTAAALEEEAITNYRALIGAFACAGAVREGVSAVRERLDSLVAALPMLVSSARTFASAADEAERQRRARREALGHLDRVMDVLEIPRLLLTLIQAQLYDEALELYAYVEKITARARRSVRSGQPMRAAGGSGGCPSLVAWVGLLEHVREECQVLGARLAAEQLSVLRGPVSLSTSLRSVGFLRRLGDSAALNAPVGGGVIGAVAYGDIDGLARETWLRLLFLAARGACITAALDEVATGTGDAASAALVVGVCDQTRAGLFEAVTHYQAVFADEEVFRGSARAPTPFERPAGGDDDDDLPAEAYDFVEVDVDADLGTDEAAGADVFGARVRGQAVLNDWVGGAVTNLLRRVQTGLFTLSEGAAVASAAEPAMACGQSLGRVGADLRPTLAPMLTSAIGRVFLDRLDDTLRRLDIMLDNYRWLPVGGSAPLTTAEVASGGGTSRGTPAGGDVTAARSIAGTASANGDAPPATFLADGASPSDSGDQEPPISVLWSPPLAVYTNGLLCALNEVRQLPAEALAGDICAALTDALCRGGTAIATSAGTAGVWLASPEERRYWVAGATAFVIVVAPHVSAAADRILGRAGLVDRAALRTTLYNTFDLVIRVSPPPPPAVPAEVRVGKGPAPPPPAQPAEGEVGLSGVPGFITSTPLERAIGDGGDGARSPVLSIPAKELGIDDTS